MGRRRLVSAIGIAFCVGALVTTAALRVPEPVRRGDAPATAGPPADHEGVDVPGKGAAGRDDNAIEGPTVHPPSESRTGSSARGTVGIRDEIVEELRARDLLMPVKGVQPDELTDTFASARGEGRHEALDILAPRHTPVRAVDDGRIAKLFTSKRGGLTIYQFDRDQHYCYYYAHLDAYAEDLAEGEHVHRGDTIGYVGTSGNAPPDTPHLHFAIFLLGPERHWWEGTPVNPYPLFED